MGVGDVGEVPGWTRGTGHTASVDDGGGAKRKRDPGLVGRNRVDERDASGESSWDWIDFGDSAWC